MVQVIVLQNTEKIVRIYVSQSLSSVSKHASPHVSPVFGSNVVHFGREVLMCFNFKDILCAHFSSLCIKCFHRFVSSKKLLITVSQLIVFRVTWKTLVIMEGIVVVTVDMWLSEETNFLKKGAEGIETTETSHWGIYILCEGKTSVWRWCTVNVSMYSLILQTFKLAIQTIMH